MLQAVMEKAAAWNVLQQGGLGKPPANQETYDFSRSSLVEQHECLATILHAAVEKRHATVNDFQDFLKVIRKADKYDHFLGMPKFALMYLASNVTNSCLLSSSPVPCHCRIPDGLRLD
jgi:hypothetical protein